MTLRNARSIRGLLIWVFAATWIACAAGQTFSTLVLFNGTNGSFPNGYLVQGPDGSFYGTTAFGGTGHTGDCGNYGCGTIFKITGAGQLTTIYNFNVIDGASPDPLLLASDGNFYGTTQLGGSFNAGTVFRLTPAGALTTLYNFNTGNGANSFAGLMQAGNGRLYGARATGGTFNFGTVFEITLDGAFKTVHNFRSGEGTDPQTGLVQGRDGLLYGSTSSMDGVSGSALFTISNAGAYQVLHDFGFNAYPSSLTGPAGGIYYGVTEGGGTDNFGTVYKITPHGALTILHNFTLQEGASYPESSMIEATDGNFYGTTTYNYSPGTIFEITPAGAFSVLHSFNIVEPYSVFFGGLLQGTDGNFYGASTLGGPSNDQCYLGSCGTLYVLSKGFGSFVKAVPASGKPGSTITILGTNLTGTTAVTFNGVSAPFTVVLPTEITATVPDGATTGPIHVTTPSATLSSYPAFFVRPH